MTEFKRFVRFLKKLVKGEDVLAVTLPEETWDAQFKKGKWDFLKSDQGNTEHIASLISEMEKDTEKSLLDIGCGNAGLLACLRERGSNVTYTGVDISPYIVEENMKVFPRDIFIASSIKDLNLKKTFNLIILSEVLYYAPYKEVFSMAKRHAEEDTLLIISMYTSWRNRALWLLSKQYLEVLSKSKVSRGKNKWAIVVGRLK